VADIFISYSKQHPQPTREVAAYLEREGYSVWWDTNLTSGEIFREVIDRELDAARAVIVIWADHSVTSEWVIAEADHAKRDGKLVPLRTGDLDAWRIPKPYSTYHTDIVNDHAAILRAVRRVVGQEIDSGEFVPDEAPKFTQPSKPALHRRLFNSAVDILSVVTWVKGTISKVSWGDYAFFLIGLLFSALLWIAIAWYGNDFWTSILSNTVAPLPLEEAITADVPPAAGSPVPASDALAQVIPAPDAVLSGTSALPTPPGPTSWSAAPAASLPWPAAAGAPSGPRATSSDAPGDKAANDDKRDALLNEFMEWRREGLRRAAEKGDRRAALALGEAYDPIMLKRAGSKDKGDPAQARVWYQKAAELGSTEAASRLKRLQTDQ